MPVPMRCFVDQIEPGVFVGLLGQISESLRHLDKSKTRLRIMGSLGHLQTIPGDPAVLVLPLHVRGLCQGSKDCISQSATSRIGSRAPGEKCGRTAEFEDRAALEGFAEEAARLQRIHGGHAGRAQGCGLETVSVKPGPFSLRLALESSELSTGGFVWIDMFEYWKHVF